MCGGGWVGALMDIMMHQPDCLSWKDWLTRGARALVDSHSEIPSLLRAAPGGATCVTGPQQGLSMEMSNKTLAISTQVRDFSEGPF